MATLIWQCHEANIIFTCTENAGSVPVQQWGGSKVVAQNGRSVSVGPLLSMLEEETAESWEDRVLVPHRAIAALAEHQIRSLGMPDASPLRLCLAADGTLAGENYNLTAGFVRSNGQRVIGFRRTGVLLRVGNAEYTLTDPHYSILETIDRFNASHHEKATDRLLALAPLKELLDPTTEITDGFLNSVQVSRASAFTILPFVNQQQELDFTVRLLKDREKPEAVDDVAADRETLVESALPGAPEAIFQRLFLRGNVPLSGYPLQGNWYAFLSPDVRMSLGVVRQALAEGQDVRRDFISNPAGFLRARLGDAMSEAAIESVFVETGEYSERVREIGLWHPPVLPFLKHASEPWLPPESVGLRIGDQLVEIPLDQIPALLEEVREAVASGRSEVKHGDTAIPATAETIAALEDIERKTTAAGEQPQTTGGQDEQGEEEAAEKEERRVLVIKDNLLDVEFGAANRDRQEALSAVPPPDLRSSAYDHQREGFDWLRTHFGVNTSGALLADDMGLGKTLQTLWFLAWVRKCAQQGRIAERPFLVVAPTGLLKNWLDEHDLHPLPPGLGEAVQGYGKELATLKLPDAVGGRNAETRFGQPVLDTVRLGQAGWVVTTYETLRDYQISFGRIHWGVVVFDEIQKIKNPAALMTNAAKSLKSDFTIALTGTPVENRLADLWCIVDTIQPARLGALREFVRQYETDDLDRLDALRKDLAGDGKPAGDGGAPAIMLRRMKEDHLSGLPEITCRRMEMVMPPPQAEKYSEIVQHARASGGGSQKILGALQNLRSVSLHPFPKTDETDEDYIAASARLTRAFEVLDRVSARSEKALVFIESKDMQGWFTEIAMRRYRLAQRPLLINGDVSGGERKNRVDRFQRREGFDLMLLSPKAGGVGLTLTAANHVIHLSRWWNPAVEDQCTDRVYRIGQQRPVRVYYPMAISPDNPEFSFDRKLDALLENKRRLSRTVLAPPSGSNAELEALFRETVGV